MHNYLQTVISQYQTSPSMTAMLSSWNDSVDPAKDIRNFFETIWNIETATGYGLDVWGRIVGAPRVIADHGGGSPITLSDTDYRTLILLKAQSNLSNCSVPSVNALLSGLYADRGVAYVVNTGGMTAAYHFLFTLTDTDYSMFDSGVLPRPAGVTVTIVQGS